MDNNGIDISLLNADGKPVIYRDTLSRLRVVLTNHTSIHIPFTTGENATAFEIILPDFFTLADLQKINIVAENWVFSIQEENVSLLLHFIGAEKTLWADGADWSFEMTGMQTNAQPGSDTVRVNLLNFPEDTPPQLLATLNILNPPKQGNGDLTKTLQVFLDDQGSILVSPAHDPLQNAVFLNIKNIGTTPLYKGTKMWQGEPTITVYFIYGTTTGSLAPDDNPDAGPGSGSAWNIKAQIPYQAAQNIWHIDNADNRPSRRPPKWVFTPSNLNPGIIGTDQNATVTFRFDQIISVTPPGHTQMIVQFSGFMLDENTPYDDAVFVLDMVKQNAPATRGLINFFSPTPMLSVSQPDTPIVIPLRWAMFNVASANLITNYPGVEPLVIPYPNPPAIGYDQKTITIPGTTRSTAVAVTLQAFNGTGGLLNSMQFMVFVKANMFVDPRDGKVYPVVKVNKRIWMAANLNYKPKSGSDTIGKEEQYGRLYQWPAVQPGDTPDGWRLPNKADWEDLFKTFTYEQLIAGGSSGFNAQLNGRKDNNGNINDFGKYGYYWTSVNNSDKIDYVALSSASKSRNYIGGSNALAGNYLLSVRYVKDVS